MVSNTHEDDKIVVSKEASPVSSPKNTYVSNKSDLKEASSSNKSALSKVIYNDPFIKVHHVLMWKNISLSFHEKMKSDNALCL